MAKNYSVDNKKREIKGNISSLSNQDKEDIKALIDFGYTFIQVDPEPKKRKPSTILKREVYIEKLTKEQYQEFLTIEKEGKFVAAAHWANEQIKK